MKYASLFALGLIALSFSCKKPDSEPNPNPADTTKTPVDTITYDTSGSFAVTTPDLAIYEVNMRAQGAAGKYGSFIPQLDSIKRLGLNTVWFMPLFPVGQVRSAGGLGSPYAPQNYGVVNTEFGTEAEFKALVEAAHARKLNVIVDWVANHTSWDHAWITDHPDWYSKDANGNMIAPPGTNWTDVAELNFDNADMRLAMIGHMKHWLTDYKVDGFRCDATDFVPTPFWKQAIDSLKKVPTERPLILLAEGSRMDQLGAGFQMLYGFNYYTSLKSVLRSSLPGTNIVAAHQGEYSGFSYGKHRLRYTTNHDMTAWEETPMDLYTTPEGALSASVLAVTMGGVPLIYNGQEVGDPQKLPLFYTSTINWSLNPAMKEGYRQLMKARQSSQALRTGGLANYATSDVCAFTRRADTETVLVLVNVRNRESTYAVPAALQNLSWATMTGTPEAIGTSVTLPARGYKILRQQ